jgi:hypothetical protein
MKTCRNSFMDGSLAVDDPRRHPARWTLFQTTCYALLDVLAPQQEDRQGGLGTGDGGDRRTQERDRPPKPTQLARLDHLPVAGPILRRALAIDPGQRYQSAAEFASVVAPHAAGAKAEAAVLIRQLFDDELRAHAP